MKKKLLCGVIMAAVITLCTDQTDGTVNINVWQRI